MKVKGINASSIKTKAQIKEAFAKLLKEKRNIKNMTITELVQIAGITRGAFYTHYDNIYDVAREFQDEFLDVIFNEDFKVTSLDSMDEYLDMVINHLKENEELYKMILSSDEPLLFMNRLNRMMNKHLNDFFLEKQNKDINLTITFFVNGSIILFIKYFRGEINTSLDELKIFIKKNYKKLFL